MPTALRYLLQATVAGVVAALLLLLGVRARSAEAQWGSETTAEQTPTEEAQPVTPTSSPRSVDACTLITQAEAQAALGVSVTAVGDAGQCTYVAGDLSGRSVSVAMSPVPATEDGVVTAAMSQLAQAMHGEVRQVDAGDEASLILSDMVSQIGARIGNEMLVVVLTAPSGSRDQQATALTDLANAALTRL